MQALGVLEAKVLERTAYAVRGVRQISAEKPKVDHDLRP